MNDILKGIHEAMKLIESLPPMAQRIRFRDKADMIHLLNEPPIEEGFRDMASAVLAIPVVFDPEVPPGQYKIDY